ncbi:MAG: AtpZ/AtpI family protein [Gemmataceae bacterium]
MIGKPVDRPLLARLLALSVVGVEMIAPAVIGLAVDRWLGIAPWGLIGGTLIGFSAAMIHLVRLSQPKAGPDSTRGKSVS